MNTTTAVLVTGLKKHFGTFEAVRGVDFKVEAGEVFSLLGPNGAGKSTTISILSGLLEPSAGEAWIYGNAVSGNSLAARRELGVVPQEIALYPDLTARENLVFWGKMYGLRGEALNLQVECVLDLIGLRDRQKDLVGKFSGGMKRRVNIGAALLHQPRVVIMDEPTVGIDPQSRRHILDGVKELNRQGVTVIYTTHYMEEAEELSTHIAIMDSGRIIANGTHGELIRMVGESTRVEMEVTAAEKAEQIWKSFPGVQQLQRTESHLTLLTADSNLLLPQLFESASREGFRIHSIEICEPNLEAVFLHLTGKGLRD